MKLDSKTKENLINQASEARKNARVPVSGFHVGSALLADNGDIITGCNMELKQMMKSICAEQSALSRATTMGYKNFHAIAIVSDAAQPISPCGFCRQFLVDFGLDLLVIMADSSGKVVVEMTIGDLMPFTFLGADMCR